MRQVGVGLLFLLALSNAAAEDRPNVLLIITDDQGYGDLGGHGNPHVRTPALDRLAAESIRFDRFFVSPLCAPTRASLLTGRYSLRTGVHGVSSGQETMRSEEITLAEVLRDAGYRTGLFGKWHNGEHYPHTPQGQGFERVFGYNLGHWNNYFDTTLLDQGQPVKTKGYIVDVLTDAAIEWIKAPQATAPFFAYVSLTTPHSPHQVPDKYFDRYKEMGLSDELACIYGMCENLDENVARLLKTLGEQQLRENTIVLFLTDNGPNGDRFNAGMKGRKGTLHEGGSRVPLFVRWPKRFKESRVVEPIAAHIDLFPTLVELCGIDAPKTLPQDGRSLVPLMEDESSRWPKRTLFTQHQLPGPKGNARAAVRTDQYRAVRDGQRWELYDMREDPGQTHNVASEQPDVIAELQKKYAEWWQDISRDLQKPHDQWQVGHDEEKRVELSVPLSKFSGGLKFSGRHPNNAWLVGWTSKEAAVEWEVEVAQAGDYAIELLYLCPEENAGSTIVVQSGDQSIDAMVKATPVKQVPSPDRVPRGEVYEMEWSTLPVGMLKLAAGVATLKVSARELAGKEALELKAIVVTRN